MHLTLNDELNLLRSARSGEVEMSEDELVSGTAAFERAIEANANKAKQSNGSRRGTTRLRSRGALWAGVGIVAAGSMAGVALIATPAPVLEPVLGPAAPKDPHAAAVELLQKAADEILAAEVQPQPGQFLKVSCRATDLTFPNTPEFLFEGEPPSAYQRKTTNQATYVPADDAQEQVIRVSPKYDTEVLVGEFPDEPEAEIYDGRSALGPDDYFEMRLPGGIADPGFVLPESPAELRSVALLQWEDMKRKDVEYTPEQALLNALLPYVNDTMPRDIRAEAFRLLAEQPNVRLEAHRGGGDFLRYVPEDHELEAVTFETLRGYETQLVFDPQDARLLGARVTMTAEDPLSPGLRAGDELNARYCRTSIVDEVPEVETWE